MLGLPARPLLLLLALFSLAGAAEPPASVDELVSTLQASLREYGRDIPQWLRDEIQSNNLTRKAVRMLTEPATFSISFDGQTVEKKVVHGFRPLNDTKKTRVNIDPSKIWQIGKAIWDLVKNNKAVVNYSTDWSGAVPADVTDWTQLTEWKTWKSKMYKFEFKNFLGQKLTEFEWAFTCQYAGKYQGKGQYLTLCGASINEIYAYGLYGEEVQASAKGSDPFNYGTSDDPIGGLNLQVTMSSQGHFEKTVVGCQITMKGDSTYTTIQCDQN